MKKKTKVLIARIVAFILVAAMVLPLIISLVETHTHVH